MVSIVIFACKSTDLARVRVPTNVHIPYALYINRQQNLSFARVQENKITMYTLCLATCTVGALPFIENACYNRQTHCGRYVYPPAATATASVARTTSTTLHIVHSYTDNVLKDGKSQSLPESFPPWRRLAFPMVILTKIIRLLRVITKLNELL